MHPALVPIVDRRAPAGPDQWDALWRALADGALDRGDAVALLASLTAALPETDSLLALLDTLDRRRPARPATPWPGTVNVVGTGGGPPTVNLSTASALVAAACGVRVLKSGSRAHTARTGSIDLLDRLGVPLCASLDRASGQLDAHGIAFTGPFVYPAQLARLARLAVPTSMRVFGRFLNTVGPFLADVPVSAQVTGVSGGELPPALRAVAARPGAPTTWLVTNPLGADELLSICDNTIHLPDGSTLTLRAGDLVPADGSPDDLAPVSREAVADHFRTVLAGRAGGPLRATLQLNAAALAMASGHRDDWAKAVAEAGAALDERAALDLLERLTGVDHGR
ncbi:anthranilate phosphoribosyltransferase [Streptomyces sp. NPDC017520]|uniref:anthranilate phosphoribosyltransferase n=1 Tax=Streptomyces sp. NPDC017520 TaxID=3364998 RepID=UPI0037989E95